MLQVEFHDHLLDRKGSQFVFQWAKVVFIAKDSLVS